MNNQERTLYWQQQLDDWQRSGLSGAAFCKRQTLSYHRFIYWRHKLTGSAKEAETEGTPRAGFARVRQVSASPYASQLTLTLPGGMAITGLGADNVGLLAAILKQL